MCRIKVLWSLPTWNMGFLSSKVESKNGERRGIGIRNKEWRNLTRNPIKRTNGVFLSVWMHIMPPLRFSHRFWFSYLFPFLSWFLNEWTSWQLFFLIKKQNCYQLFFRTMNRDCSATETGDVHVVFDSSSEMSLNFDTIWRSPWELLF